MLKIISKIILYFSIFSSIYVLSTSCKPKPKVLINSNSICDLTDSTFEEFIDKPNVTLIYFWAEWCGYCTKFSPIIEDLAKENICEIAKVNIDKCINTYRNYKEKYIPMILIFKNGVLKAKIIGTTSKSEILNKINESK